MRFRNAVDPLIPLSGGFFGGFALLLESKTRYGYFDLKSLRNYVKYCTKIFWDHHKFT